MNGPPVGLILFDALDIVLKHQLAEAEQLNGVEIVGNHGGDLCGIADVEDEGLQIAAILLDNAVFSGVTTLKDAAVVRAWGTTKGLGEIALNGPTSSTKLDPCGTVRFPASSVLFSIDCIK